MASPDISLAVLGTGRLAYGCTDLTTAWPHGGTGLGLVGGVRILPPNVYKPLVAEETNGPDAVLYLGGALLLGCMLEAWQDDAISAVFPSSTTISGGKVVQWPGSGTQAGSSVSALSKLVFTPTNTSHPGVLIYSAAPLIEVNAELRMSAYSYLRTPVVFVALPDASSRLGAMGTIARLATVLT